MKSLPRLAFPLTLVCLVLAAVPAVRAQVVTPNPAPTIIKTAPYIITKPGFYQLGADLIVSKTSGDIITIKASNVILDFGGHYISGSGAFATTTLIGVNSLEQGNLVIRNGTIAACYVGIDLNGNAQANSLNINQRVDNMLVSYCSYIGIDLYAASNSEITNCNLSFIGGSSTQGDAYGIYSSGPGGSNNVRGNTISGVTGGSTAGNYGYGIIGFNICSGNRVSEVLSRAGSSYGTGIGGVSVAYDNVVTDCYNGISASVYQRNITYLCHNPFSGGTDAGLNH